MCREEAATKQPHTWRHQSHSDEELTAQHVTQPQQLQQQQQQLQQLCRVDFYDDARYLVASSCVEFVFPFITVTIINILIYVNIRRRSDDDPTKTNTHCVQGQLTPNSNSLAMDHILY